MKIFTLTVKPDLPSSTKNWTDTSMKEGVKASPNSSNRIYICLAGVNSLSDGDDRIQARMDSGTVGRYSVNRHRQSELKPPSLIKLHSPTLYVLLKTLKVDVLRETRWLFMIWLCKTNVICHLTSKPVNTDSCSNARTHKRIKQVYFCE